MDFKDCVKFANETHTCYLATVEGDQPRVRPLGMWFADDTGFYFESKSVKALCKQLGKNPKVEVVFHAREEQSLGKVLRIAGRVEFINDMALRTRVYEERPRLKTQIKGPEDPLMTIFRISSGEAHFWTAASSMYEDDVELIKF
jgi:pyridoxamine 5'-phosphate oxidase